MPGGPTGDHGITNLWESGSQRCYRVFPLRSVSLSNVRCWVSSLNSRLSVMRRIVIKSNKKLAQQAQDDLASLSNAERERVEEAARLEGITLQEALERKRGFRYLY